MKFNTRSNTIKAKFLLIRVPLILVLTVLVLRMFDVISNPRILIGFALLFVLSLASTIIFRLHYLEVEISKKVLDIKYYHIFPLIREYQHIEINIENLVKVEIKKHLAGLVRVLVLSVKTENGIASFPEIPIILLKRNEQAELLTILSRAI